MSPLELAVGVPFGEDGPPEPLPKTGPTDPVAALEQAMLPALRRGPCLVAFSGGQDSARVLACAVRAARSENLPLPIPISMHAPGQLDIRDREMPNGRREQLVRFLGISDWEHVELDEDLDYLGAAATGILRGHGAVYPANVHVITPMLERARGRTLIIGHAGRELLTFWHGRPVCDMLARRRRPDRAVLVQAALALGPRRLRATRLRPTIEAPPPWLRPQARAEFVEARADEVAGEPLFWTDAVARGLVKRCLRATWQSFAKLTDDYDVAIETPYGSREFLGALARAGGRLGWGGAEEFRQHFDSRILPAFEPSQRPQPEGQQRSDAGAGPPADPGPDPMWGPAARAFAESWNGEGLDPELVDGERLREAWLQNNHQGALLLHSAWLATAARSLA